MPALLEFAFNVLFTAHLLAVNLAMAAPLVCIWLDRRETLHSDRAAGELGKHLAWLCCGSLLFGGTLGALMLWWMWRLEHATYESVFGILPAARWWFLIGELVFYFVCMAGYALLWHRLHSRRFWHRVLAVVAATNLIYHFPPLFVSLSVASTRADMAGRPYDHKAFLQLWGDGEVLSRIVHHWLAAIAIAGIALIALSTRQLNSRDDLAASDNALSAFGAKLALAATALQIPAGIWLLVQLPPTDRMAILGHDAVAASYFAVSILTAVVLLQTLITISLGETNRRQGTTATTCLVLTVFFMVSALERINQRQTTIHNTETTASNAAD